MNSILYVSIARHPRELKDLIRQKLRESNLTFTEINYEEIEALSKLDLTNFEAVLLAPARYFPVEYMSKLKACKLIQIWSSGFDKFNYSDAAKFKIPVANNNGSNANAVAEHAINCILSLLKRNREMLSRTIVDNWEGNDHGMNSFEFQGKTLGIIGYGNIGKRVAEIAKVFGANVIFYDKNEKLHSLDNFRPLEMLFQNSEIISLHLHLNKETRNFISEFEFSLMRNMPFLINVSRAELVNYEALLKSLRSGIIRGLAMDVHYREPNDKKDELYLFENTFFSPHIAGSTYDTYNKALDFCVKNIQFAISGQDPLSLI